MTRNRFPGSCGCGQRLAAGAGVLCRVDDGWAVRCDGCPEPEGAAPGRAVRGRRKSAKAPARRKARSGAARKRSWGGTRKRAARKAAPAKRARSAGRKGASSRRAAFPDVERETDWSLVYTPIRYGASVALPGGGTAPCTPDYARIAAEAERAKGARELDLLVTLVELRARGHLGEAA